MTQTHKGIYVLFNYLTFTEIKEKLDLSASVGTQGQMIQDAGSGTQNLVHLGEYGRIRYCKFPVAQTLGYTA